MQKRHCFQAPDLVPMHLSLVVPQASSRRKKWHDDTSKVISRHRQGLSAKGDRSKDTGEGPGWAGIEVLVALGVGIERLIRFEFGFWGPAFLRG